MENMPLISVIIPVYKAESFLKSCLESVVNQTYKNLEIILIDDGSPDNCGVICDEYKDKDSRIIVIHQENQGTSSARNTGLSIASGEYICFLDCDDFANIYLIETLLSICKEKNVKMAVSSFVEAQYDEVFTRNTAKPKRHDIEILNPIIYIERLCTSMQVLYVVPWAKLYHKSIYNEVQFPAGALNEDDCVIDNVLYKAKEIAVEYTPLMHYRKNPNSQSRLGIKADKWLKSVPYKEMRMNTLKDLGEYDVLYKVQRLFFYDLLIEASNQTDKSIRKTFISIANKTYSSILKNPKHSKKEVFSMLTFILNPNKAKNYTHNDFLSN